MLLREFNFRQDLFSNQLKRECHLYYSKTFEQVLLILVFMYRQ